MKQKQKKKFKNVLVQGPGYTKRPFGHELLKLNKKCELNKSF